MMTAIRRLTLEAFRNYDHLSFDLSPDPIVLVGENGAGKTNCLEAISLLSPGRGLRRAALSELQNRSVSRPWVAAFDCEGLQGPVHIGLGRDPESGERDKRIIRIDGKTARSQSILNDHIAVIWLTPDMDRLLAESASDRRRFMDRMVYVLHPDHLMHINRYEEAMRSRNRLLQEGPFDASWMNALEDNMAQDGVAIAAARLHWQNDLGPHLLNDPAPFPRMRLAIEGSVERIIENEAAVDAEERVRTLLKEQRPQDAASGTTQTGPHRSDLKVFHADKDCAADLCSTGEQKALLISLVLAQSRLLKQIRGGAPLLLLDDIMAHLDESRRRGLSRQLDELHAQSWLTGTDRSFFASLEGKAQFLLIDHAQLTALDLPA